MKYLLAESSWDQEELKAIQRVIDSNRYSMGVEVENFEKNFAKYFNTKYAVMVNSGSSANLLAVGALFYTKNPLLKRGDEVIVPAVSWPTTYYPLQQYGLKIKFVDVDAQTLNFDLRALREAVTDKTRMILAVNLLGNPNDFDTINEIIGKRDILLMEDNCESMGAKFKGKFAGTFGVMGTFSSFFSHHISTMEGGMITTDNEELYHVLLSMRAHGWTRNLPKNNLVTGTKSDIPFEESFKFVLPGYNMRPLEMSGAIGIEQLKKLPSFVENRRKNALLFKKHFENHPHLTIQKEIGESSWFGFAFLIKKDAPFTRTQLATHLEMQGIECRPIVAGNFVKNKVVQFFDHEVHGELKGANEIDAQGLFVGNHHFEMKEHLDLLNKVFLP